MTGYSASVTRSAGSDRTCLNPMATMYQTDAAQVPSSRCDQPSHQPVYQRPSSCCTSTLRGSSYRRTRDSGTRSTVGGAS